MSSSKAAAISAYLAQNLPLLTGLTAVTGWDASSNPYVILGTNTAGSNTAIVKIVTETAIGTNSIGQTQPVYTPHRAQFAFEDVNGSGTHAITEKTKAQIMAELAKQGTAIDMYVLATGTAPTNANLITATASAPTVTVVPDMWNPLTNQQ